MSQGYAFVARRGALELKVTVCPLADLKPHELTVESLLKRLIKAIVRSGVVYDPLIVDEASLVVLDGMHRLEALRRVGARFVPVCLVDYMSDEILLKRWFRVVRNPPDSRAVEGKLASMGLSVERVSFAEARRMVDEREAHFAIHWRDSSLVAKGSCVSVAEAFAKLREVEGFMSRLGSAISYLAEEEALETFAEGGCALITTMQLSKREVVELAERGVLLAPKSTRHVIPVRPLSVNVPLELLTYSVSQSALTRWLSRYLSGRRAVLLRGGAVVRGRRYEEDVLVFS